MTAAAADGGGTARRQSDGAAGRQLDGAAGRRAGGSGAGRLRGEKRWLPLIAGGLLLASGCQRRPAVPEARPGPVAAAGAVHPSGAVDAAGAVASSVDAAGAVASSVDAAGAVASAVDAAGAVASSGGAAGAVDAVGRLGASAADAADLGARPEDEPANILRAAEFAWTQQADRVLAGELLQTALAAISRRLGAPVQVVAALAQGLADPNFATVPRAEVALAAGSDRLAIGHGRLLSVVDLHGTGRSHGETEPPAQLIRLAESPAPLRRVVLDRDGEHVATLADDGIARLLPVNGNPGFAWPLLSPPDPVQHELVGTEAAYRASWLDFSPDARALLLADCGVVASVACPLRRLRVFTTDRGQPLPPITAGELELLDYTARRDGTVAVLFFGRPPRLYQTSTGTELPLTSTLHGKLAAACLAGSHVPLPGERGWVVSPDRRWLATLAAPTTLCLWDLNERALTAAVALTGSGLTTLRLESLLSAQAASTVVVSTAERSRGRRTYLLDAQTGQRTAELAGPIAVMPLDDDGALLSGRLLDGPRRGGLQLYRLHPGGQLVRLPGLELPALRCLADFPDAVAGEGTLALFSPLDPAVTPDCPPALVTIGPLPKLATHVGRLALLGRAPIAAASFVGTPNRLVIVDAAARLQTLVGTQVRYTTPPIAAAVTRLGFAAPGDGEQLLLGTADGQTTELWTTGGTLRSFPTPASVPSSDQAAPPGAVSADGRLRAALEPRPAGSPASRSLSLRDATGALRWQAPLSGLPPVTALAFTPDTSLLLVGGTGGTVVWRRVTDGHQRLRLQLVPGGAVALTPDGRFELLGEVDRPEDYVICRAGPYQLPFPLCKSRLRTRGLLATALRP